MKKLLIIVTIVSILNLIILVLIYSNVLLDVGNFVSVNTCDTVISKVRIDSIEYVIRSKDSIINKIIYDEKKYIEKANELSDTASVELFKRLVSE